MGWEVGGEGGGAVLFYEEGERGEGGVNDFSLGLWGGQGV